MSLPLTINGQTYFYPQTGDRNWGPDATDWAVAVTNGMLQKAGGLFLLLSEVDFGPNYGLKSIYFKSNHPVLPTDGILRLARTDYIAWRDEGDLNDLYLSVNASDELLFNGNPLAVVTSVTDTNSIDLVLTGKALSANLKLSSTGADSGYISSDLQIETDGLRAQVPIMIGDAGFGGSAGVVPAPTAGDGVNKFLKADGTWAVPPGGGGGYTFNDTNSIDLDDAANIITANVKLSSDPADTGYQYVELQIETDGLRAQITDTNIINAIPDADSLTTGLLTSTDWTTFNAKQAAGNYITGLTGDVTATGPGSVAATIANSAVTNSKMADMAQSTIKGRQSGAGTGAPQDLTASQATAILDAMVGDSGSGGTKGLVPAPAAGDAAANKFLKADGTWAASGSLPSLGPEMSILKTFSGAASFQVDWDDMSKVRSDKDTGVFKTIEWFDDTNTLRKKSVLSGGTAPEFTTRTVTFYDTDGVTVLDTLVYTLTYDIDGDFEKEEL